MPDNTNQAYPWMPTSEQVQKYIRIAGYYFSGWATAKGWDGNLILLLGGVLYLGLNIGWTISSSGLVKLLNEVAKYKKVQEIVVTDPKLATAEVTPSPKITST